ncbi:hypothetical protein Adu01nite_14210 [Paractinoplanes durhamensis]|uniref:Secreted protein n=1 Tax=Paractinoplanes durhamensis TaxID=113563 RepID=A0ABQ3YR60_9ACTN|nr:hypothetical protein Adu01nite_14210 [Actinoplanes durhamensis]
MVARPAPGEQVTTGEGSAFQRLRSLRRTTPGRLQLILAALVAAGLLAGLVAGLTAASARSGTADLGDRAQPLLVQAEAIYSGLADADTTAAQAFLAGGLEPAALTDRYNTRLTQATTALAEAARLTPAGSEAAASVEALSNGVARYTALVATARADNRQGLPVGSSYLSSASTLNRETLLPEAKKLFDMAQQEVEDGYRSAASSWWVTVAGLAILLLLGALLLAQRYLSRHTHRTFNVPLLAATILTVLLGLGTATVFIGQGRHLDRAGDTGSTPVAELADARILALEERGDEALTLALHGSSDEPEKRWQENNPLLADALTNEYLPSSTAASYTTYADAHQKIRDLDEKIGDYDGAVALAIGKDTTAAFEQVTTDIGTALDERKAAFTDEIGAAGNGLGLLMILGPLAALAICGLAFAGIRARLEEYR